MNQEVVCLRELANTINEKSASQYRTEVHTKNLPSFDSMRVHAAKPRNVHTNNLPTNREHKSNLTPIDEAAYSPEQEETLHESSARLEARMMPI